MHNKYSSIDIEIIQFDYLELYTDVVITSGDKNNDDFTEVDPA